MSVWSSLINKFRLTVDEDEDGYFDEEDDYVEEKPSKKRFFNKRDDDEEEEEYEEEESKPRFFRPNNKVVSMRSKQMQVSLVKPTSMEDSKEIANYLLQGKAVLLNMEGMHMELAQRIIDFTGGATYSMNGSLQKVSNYIFIATPQTVELTGDFQELLSDGNVTIAGMNYHF